MSSPHTPAFTRAWRSKATRRPVLLCQINILLPDAVTLNLASEEIYVNDVLWQSGITDWQGVRDGSPLLSPGPDYVTTSITLARRVLSALGDGAVDSLAGHVWHGAGITLWLWEKSLTDPDDRAQIFDGRINSIKTTEAGVELTCMQGTVRGQIPNKIVTKGTYPNAPDIGASLVIPVAYGQFRALNMRSPWPLAYADKEAQENAGGGLGAVPGVITDPGYGGNKLRITWADHPIQTIFDRSTGFSHFIVAGDRLAPLDAVGLNGFRTGDSYTEIDDDYLTAYYGVPGSDIYTVATTADPNTAGNARNAMNVLDETTYAVIDQSLGQNQLFLALPNPSAFGMAIDFHFEFAYSGNAANTHNLQAFAHDPFTLTSATVHAIAATSATPAVASYTDFSNTVKSQWNVAGDGNTTTLGIAFNFAGGTTNKAHIYWAVVKIKYRPSRTLALPGEGTDLLTGRPLATTGAGIPFIGGSTIAPGANGHWIFQKRAAIFEVTGSFYAQLEGYEDTYGTYTGTAGALIERAPDIARHLLVVRAGVSAGAIETGASEFGSLVAARTLLRGGYGADWDLACFINQPTYVQAVLQSIAQQSCSLLYLDRLDSKWKWICWNRNQAQTYDYALGKLALAKIPEQGGSSLIGARQTVRVPFYYDHFRGRAMFEAMVGPTGSTRGFSQSDIRDQRMVVDNSNNKLDWTGNTSETNYSSTLTNGEYIAIDLAAHVATLMRVHNPDQFVGWGFSVKAGYNDKLDVRVPTGGALATATMDEGDYTPEGFCRAIVAALNGLALGRTFSCTYDYSTNLFTLSATGGTFDIIQNYTDGAWWSVGLQSAVAVSSETSAWPRYNDRFWFNVGSASYYQGFRFGTGANSANGAWKVLGFEQDDYPTRASGTPIPDYVAPFERSQRELLALASADTWGDSEDLVLPSSYIRKEDVAVMYRNRVFDLMREPPYPVTFTTFGDCPDMRRGDVFATEAGLDDWDAYGRYGSDGSWGGKLFMVLEVFQAGAPNWNQEIVAFEVMGDDKTLADAQNTYTGLLGASSVS